MIKLFKINYKIKLSRVRDRVIRVFGWVLSDVGYKNSLLSSLVHSYNTQLKLKITRKQDH